MNVKRKTSLEHKTKFMIGIVFVVLMLLVARLSFMQLVQAEQYRTMAQNNYIRITPVFAPRGEIFDCNGEKIVTNKPVYTVSISDMDLQGSTYHLYLDKSSAVTPEMADVLAGILTEDEECVQYFQQMSGKTPEKFNNEVTKSSEEATYAAKKNAIENIIKERVSRNKVSLDNGRPLEIAVVYNPSMVDSLHKQNLSYFGVRLEEHTDTLSKLVTMLHEEGTFEDKTIYEVESEVRRLIREKKYYKPYEPVLVAESIPAKTVVALRERQLEMPGVVVDIQPARDYTYQTALSHVLGYVQNIKKEQYEEHKDKGYFMNDIYGQDGLEIIYESYLRGTTGARQMEVDASGQLVRDLGLKQPKPGNDLVLTIDLPLQQATEQALARGVARAQGSGFRLSKAGAAVVIDVHTGAIKAMASYPTYSPSSFTDGMSSEEWEQLQESGALLNRAISANYPPGSTFKMVTASAILEDNIVDPDYRMYDPGYYKLGTTTFNDWKPGGHGTVDMRKALEISCDIYFYRYGRQVGVEAIAAMALEFGLGEKSGIRLPGEISGVAPTPEWKYELVKNMLIMYNDDFARVRELNEQIEKAYGSAKQRLEVTRDEELAEQLAKHQWDLEWQQFETVNMSIGQGDNTYTILQLAAYVAAIANNGTLYRPYVLDKIVTNDGDIVQQNEPEVRREVSVTKEHLQILREGMHLVALPPNGTGSAMFGIDAAAKTGTSEVLDAKGQKIGNHALFVAFAPYENPEIAVAVVIEYGNAGGAYAGPVAREILDAYLDPKIDEQEQNEPKSEQFEDMNSLLADWDALPGLNWPWMELEPATKLTDNSIAEQVYDEN